MLRRIFSWLTYANVAATLALFIALGGTGYAALSLPRNSVGAREIRSGAVGHPELAGGAVRSDSVRDASLELRDLSSGARAALTGARGGTGPRGADGAVGPQGPKGDAGEDATALWAIVSLVGLRYGGTSTGVEHAGTGDYLVSFARGVAGCAYSATLARVQGAGGDPPPGRITIAEDSDRIRVRTYGITGSAEDVGFHLIVVC